ncbi:MAG: hypothetical protein ACRENF_08690 [Thermodesulfobacteriota bacterium]
MAITAEELTKLLTETKKAREALDKVLDYVDLINNNLDNLPADVKSSGEAVKDHASEIEKYIENTKRLINSELDKIPLDKDQVKEAANKLLLYQGDVSQVVHWAEGQRRNHPENSYWWRYWQAVSDIIKMQKAQQ